MNNIIKKLKNFLRRRIPLAVRRSLAVYRILSKEMGHYRSARENASFDSEGMPIPWITYPAIEFISQFDFSSKLVFEYGSGNSTLFWAKRVKHLTSVESDPLWYEHMADKIPANVEYMLHTDSADYAESISCTGKTFDIIVIDGKARLACAKAAVHQLRPGGFIILDNSDWYTESSAILRSANLIEIDFAGFCPILGHRCVTSIYLKRDLVLETLNSRQPNFIIGGKRLELDYVNQ